MNYMYGYSHEHDLRRLEDDERLIIDCPECHIIFFVALKTEETK